MYVPAGLPILSTQDGYGYILTGPTPRTSKSIAHMLSTSNDYAHPVAKGLYSLLPLGQRVVQKLSSLIDHKLDSIGTMEVLKRQLFLLGIETCKIPLELWEKSGRRNKMGCELMQLKDRRGADFCLQPTAEEMCSQLVGQLPTFKKAALPLLLYQTTDKFRDEMNPRFFTGQSRFEPIYYAHTDHREK